ncbi:hypothetical protein BJF78_01875 [Pseudonocardia sp. CNS-139]|nr:hypothetical protein BJF78_01875 [Pseudonocardia sp. CNS-139]
MALPSVAVSRTELTTPDLELGGSEISLPDVELPSLEVPSLRPRRGRLRATSPRPRAHGGGRPSSGRPVQEVADDRGETGRGRRDGR